MNDNLEKILDYSEFPVIKRETRYMNDSCYYSIAMWMKIPTLALKQMVIAYQRWDYVVLGTAIHYFYHWTLHWTLTSVFILNK